ncbi:MAG TPA: hypothetical protein VJS92_07945, partial [Candidatus Polarisedimenticolaceae bacterium]|nr:hypothetical protein [Candidatus Polarisedimenticolaceae bacterium]
LAAVFLLGLAAGAGLLLLFRAGPTSAAPAGIAPTSFQQLTLLPGGEGQPAISPDGQSFAYVKRVNDQWDIFLQRVDGRNAVNVTSGCAQDDTDPAFSPDGRSLAFRSDCAGGGIFVMGATGESVRKVTDLGFGPSWSPDGRELAVATENWLLPWARATTSELWAIEVESGKKRLLSKHDAVQPAWSPDGKRVAFWGLRDKGSQRDLWTVAADGSQSAEEAAVSLTDDRHLDWSPAWSLDGRFVYYSSTRGGTMNLWRLAVDPSSGKALGEPTALTAPSSWVGWISLSADGHKLLWVDRNARTEILRAPFDPERGELSGPARPVPLGTFELYEYFDLSPDGTAIVFANAGLPSHLFLVGVDGTGLRQLTDGPHRDRQGSFSPDGQWIVFQSSRYPAQLALIRSDGSGLRALVSDRTDGWFPAWTPEGRVGLSSTTGAYLLDPQATAPAGATEPLAPPPDGLAFDVRSADGTRIAGMLRDASARPQALAIYSRSARTYDVIVKKQDVNGAWFLPDGRRALWVEKTRLVLRDFASGATRTVLTAPAGREITWIALSRDGRWLSWLETGDESDVWMTTLE